MFRLIFVTFFLFLSACMPSGVSKSTNQKGQKPANPPQQPFILPPPSYLAENISDGKYLVLSDDSVWIVKDEDTLFSSGWISAQEIYVTLSDDHEHPYFLSTESSWAEVHAKKGDWKDIPLNRK